MRPTCKFGRTDFSFPARESRPGTAGFASDAASGRDRVFALKFPGWPGKISLPPSWQNFICETLVH